MKWLASLIGKILFIGNDKVATEKAAREYHGTDRINAAPIHESSLHLLSKQAERGAQIVYVKEK